MTSDRYTKVVLTVIAVCLSLLTLREFGVLPEAHAQSGGATRVTICDPAGRACGDDWTQYVAVMNVARVAVVDVPRR